MFKEAKLPKECKTATAIRCNVGQYNDDSHESSHIRATTCPTKATIYKNPREGGDPIKAYKILNYAYNFPGLETIFTSYTNPQLRGHSFKLYREVSRTMWRSNFLPLRVVRKWNEPDVDLIKALSTIAFKNLLDGNCSRGDVVLWIQLTMVFEV